MHPSRRAHAGFTLIELIISIVIIAAAVGGIMITVANTVARSVDPLIQTQGIIIAQGYLDEVMLRSFAAGPFACTNPDGARDQFDDAFDYDCVANLNGPRDQTGNTLPGLSAYNVTVDVTNASVNGVPSARIQVNVTHDAVPINIQLVAHKMN